MSSRMDLREALGAAVSGAETGLALADRLCRACVELLGVDGAAISVIHRGATRGTFGSSSALSQRVDAAQFTCGEGPCLDAVAQGVPVLAPDLTDVGEQRWPAFTPAVLGAGVSAVFALPVAVAHDPVGALDLFRHRPGGLSPQALDGALLAAHLGCLPLMDLMAAATRRAEAGVVEGEQDDPWRELESLERAEIYQASGFLIAQLRVDAVEALVRLRARAFATGQTASEVAFDILARRLSAEPDGSWRQDDRGTGAPGAP